MMSRVIRHDVMYHDGYLICGSLPVIFTVSYFSPPSFVFSFSSRSPHGRFQECCHVQGGAEKEQRRRQSQQEGFRYVEDGNVRQNMAHQPHLSEQLLRKTLIDIFFFLKGAIRLKLGPIIGMRVPGLSHFQPAFLNK